MDRSLDELIKENPKKFSLNKGRYQPKYENQHFNQYFQPIRLLYYPNLCEFLGLTKILEMLLE